MRPMPAFLLEQRSQCSAIASTAITLKDSQELDTHTDTKNLNVYDPVRCLIDDSPPKQFVRTVWRSLARRLGHNHETWSRY